MRRCALFVAIVAGAFLVVVGSCRLPFCPTGDDPNVVIYKPAPPPGGGVQLLGRVINFGWRSGDVRNPRHIRYMFTQVVDSNGVYNPTFDIVADMNMNPGRYETRWGPWIAYSAPGDSGRSTILGDDEVLEINRSHIFAVQAMDFCGRITKQFNRTTNVRQFIVSASALPLLSVGEPLLGYNRFLGMTSSVKSYELPPGLAVNFSWRADASSYGGEIVGYRYGWDVADINNPADWEVEFSPDHTSAPPKTWYSGVHVLYVEAIDNAASITLGGIELVIVPFTMERSLLWVDDLMSTEFTQIDYAFPRESEHDAFWLNICGGAQGFDPGRDVYDAYYAHSTTPPPLALLAKYRNIIWSFSSNGDGGVWDDMIKFTPESMIGGGSTSRAYFLSAFLARGGHLLTEGQSERAGGLAACLQPVAQVFPMNLRCEITGSRVDCDGDTSGVNTIAYRDYCVTMLDKVIGAFRGDPDLPARIVRNYDCMNYAVKADDPVTEGLVGLPDQLNLWEEITASGRYFDPAAPAPYPGGFTYVEAYDPDYWMDRNMVSSQSCFHPMFRMKTRNSMSSLNNVAVALVLTKYESIVPPVAEGVAAKSFHFGFPLWFFNRTQVDQIMGVVFSEWQIDSGL